MGWKGVVLVMMLVKLRHNLSKRKHLTQPVAANYSSDITKVRTELSVLDCYWQRL